MVRTIFEKRLNPSLIFLSRILFHMFLSVFVRQIVRVEALFLKAFKLIWNEKRCNVHTSSQRGLCVVKHLIEISSL